VVALCVKERNRSAEGEIMEKEMDRKRGVKKRPS